MIQHCAEMLAFWSEQIEHRAVLSSEDSVFFLKRHTPTSTSPIDDNASFMSG